MNEHEKYLFGLRGYIVVRNALTTEQIDDLSRRLETQRNQKNISLGSNRTQNAEGNRPGQHNHCWSGVGVTLI